MSRGGRVPRWCLDRTVEALLVLVLRLWLDSEASPRGWLGGVLDPVVGAAMAAIHAEPARA